MRLTNFGCILILSVAPKDKAAGEKGGEGRARDATPPLQDGSLRLVILNGERSNGIPVGVLDRGVSHVSMQNFAGKSLKNARDFAVLVGAESVVVKIDRDAEFSHCVSFLLKVYHGGGKKAAGRGKGSPRPAGRKSQKESSPYMGSV